MARRPVRRHDRRRHERRRRYEHEYQYDEGPPTAGRLAFICSLIVGFTIWLMRSDIAPGQNWKEGRNVYMPDPHEEKKNLLSLFSTVSEAEFEKSKINYGIHANATEFTLPPPKPTNQTTVVIVLSARQHFERRAAIRDTWARDNDNVYFVVGGPDPENDDDKNWTNPLSISSLLKREQELYRDMIDVVHPESYKSLPYKLHHGMKWVTQNVPHVNWIVKADDDHIVRVKLLQFFVLRKFNPHHPSVVGGVVVGAPPHRTGKWAEDPKFEGVVYPPWAFGSAGYVVSRAVAQYIGQKDDLYYYQGEDAGLGIWLDESPLQVTWIDTPEMNKEKACEQKYYIIGHDWDIQGMKDCFNQLGDNVPDRKSVIAFDAGRKDQHPGKIMQWSI